MIRTVAGLAGLAAATLALAVPVQAQDATAETAYSAYHRAIRAAELCEGRSFDQDAHNKMGLVIDEKVHHELGAGKRLTLIEQAKSEMGESVDRYGCNDSTVQESLALFHNELEPALQ